MHSPNEPSPSDPPDPTRQHDPVTDPNVRDPGRRDHSDVERPTDPDAPGANPQVPPANEPSPLSDDRR